MAPRAAVPPVDQLIPPSRPLGALTFQAPQEETESPSALPPFSPEEIPSDEGAAGWSSLDANEKSDPDRSDESRTSSKGSSGSALSKRALREAARTAVLGAGAAAGELLTDDAGKAVELYVTDEVDAAAIGDPLAAIVGRHGGLGDAANPDLGDAIAAAIGIGVYVWKQLGRWRAARELRAQQRIVQEQAEGAAGVGEPVQQ